MSEDILLLVDLEGIIGVKNILLYENCRKMMIDELFCVIKSLQKNGFVQITVCNIHNDGNLLNDNDASVLHFRLIKGIKCLARQGVHFQFAILLGFHGMAGSGGQFGHTFRYDFDNVYFGNKRFGEVGLYTRWLEINHVPVLLVSGEGDFKKELIPGGCEIHYVDNIRGMSLLSKYEDLAFAVENCVKKQIREPHKVSNYMVSVEVDNSDKYTLLSKSPYKYYVVDQKFLFSSLNDFFEKLFDFCVALNKSSDEILQKNILLAKRIHKKGIQKGNINSQTQDILNLPLNRIDHSARLAIEKVMGMENEHN